MRRSRPRRSARARKSSAEASEAARAEARRGVAAAGGDVLDEWEPLYFDAGQQEQNEPGSRRRRRHRSSSSTARPPKKRVRVAYDGGEAELPAPAYFGALRAATAAARLDALERTARRAERALRDAPDDDEAVRPPVVARTDDATDAALARAFAAAQAGQGPRRKKRKTRAEKRAPAKDAGPGWYGLPRADATVSADDRAALALRGVADPKRHYKRQDAPSEFAALGTVVAGKFDGGSGTLKKRERKTGLMGELLADSGARSYAKRRFTRSKKGSAGRAVDAEAKRKALARRKKGSNQVGAAVGYHPRACFAGHRLPSLSFLWGAYCRKASHAVAPCGRLLRASGRAGPRAAGGSRRRRGRGACSRRGRRCRSWCRAYWWARRRRR